MRFAFIEAEKANFPVSFLCRCLEVSRPGFYAWRKRPACRRQLEDDALKDTIVQIFKRSRRTYGSPRVHAELRAQGYQIGLNRVTRLMREAGLSVRPRKGYRCTTKADPTHPVADNLLDRDFSATTVNEKWVSDVTFVPTLQGWLYLDIMIDLYNREVVGWSMGPNNDQALTLRALDMALKGHTPPAGLVHHSDRGSTYTAGDYRQRLADNDIKCSMSRRGNCWDNAVAESFFATLKKDLVHAGQYQNRRQAEASIFEYIEVFYNRIRRHSSLGYLTPVEYRNNITTAVQSA